MEQLIKEIQKFEHDNNFEITPFLESKEGFDLIDGFYKAFIQYKVEIEETKKKYTDFFDGVGFDKIYPEYNRVLWNITWFSDVITKLQAHFKAQLRKSENEEIIKYIIEISTIHIDYLHFLNSNRRSFTMYTEYFGRFETELGFNGEDYITFKEFSDNYDEIKKLDLEEIRNLIRAQRISGK